MQLGETPGVSVTSPPKTPLFAPFHHTIPGAPTVIATTRAGRHEVVTENAASTNTNHAPPPQFIIVPPYGGYTPPRYQRQTRSRSADGPSTRSDDELAFPTVEEWLSTLTTKPKANVQDFNAIKEKFRLQNFLNMTIDDLFAVSCEELRDSYHFLGAEVSFLTKWVEAAMEKVKGSSRGKRSRKRSRIE